MDHIEDFLVYLRYERNTSPRTQEIYGGILSDYKQCVEERLGEEFAPSASDMDLIRGFLAQSMDKGAKASYISQKLSALRTYYKYLLKKEVVSKDPTLGLRAPRKERPLPVYVPTKEIEQILDTQETELQTGGDWRQIRDQLIIAIIYECGLRRSEVASLLDRDVSLPQRQLKVLGKGNKERIIPFGQGLATMIGRWQLVRKEMFGDSETFFLTLEGKPMTGQAVYSVVHRILKGVPNLSRRGAHALRHSFATDMLNSGADLVMLRELMGHSSVATTVHYTHTSFKQLQQMYNAHPRAKKTK